MGSVWSHLWEPQCGQGAKWQRLPHPHPFLNGRLAGHSLLGGDDESSLNARYDMDLFPQKIGEGQFSKAYVCWSKEDSSQRYALKVFTPDEGAEHATNEIRVLLLLGQHPRIIRLVDLHHEESRNMRLVLELCAGGQLFDRLVSRGRYKATKAACVVQEILEALAYMHGKGVMHRDLKPENVLLVSPVSDIDIKVCDFGIAKMAERSDGSVVRSARVIQSRPWPQSWPRSTSFKGSDFYLAPEMLRQEEYGPEIDLWSLGVTTFSLISGSLPFVGEGGAEDLRGTYSKIVHRDIRFDGQAWEEAPATAADFILQLLSLDPAQRPSAAQALSHGFVKSALESFVDSDEDEEEEEEEDESDLQLDELESEGGLQPGCLPAIPLSNDGLAAMSQRRAVYAAKFLRPPSWTKRLLLREKPRVLTGPFENPVRRWVRLREKARQFAELPPPRRIPVPKPARPKLLQAVEGVPRVNPEALQRRLDFLLSDAAVKQQLAAPLRPGLSPYFVEFQCWSRQLREIRRVYRAQYLQKLAEVTEVERAREAELYQKERQQRQERKQANMQRIGEDMKRRAILRDRKRIESKVNEVDSSQTLHFSIFYTPEGNNTYKKTRQQTIMRRILEEHLFQTHSGDQHTVVKSKVSSLDDADWLFRFSSDTKPAAYKAQAGFDYTEGILRLQASSLFEYPKLVVWKHVDKVVYTLICEPLDNPLLASSFLTLFVHELSDHFRKAGSLVDEVSARPDEVLAILNFMLPGGQLLFVNSNLHRFNKSQISQVLSQKAIEMARRSKLKRQRLFWFRRMETLSRLVVSSENLEEAFAAFPDSQAPSSSGSTTSSPSGVLLSRNVSIPYLLRQFGGSKADPQQKNRRIPGIDNVKREILQMSYDILGEDEERYEAEVPQEADWRSRAQQLYGDGIFNHEQKMALLDQKIAMLKGAQKFEEQKGRADLITTKLIDELEAVREAELEKSQQEELKAKQQSQRGEDPQGMPAYDPAGRIT
ncbi:CAMK4 [Symbiodinium sp. CCMP2456]|nr:CAMK4 [Symbiodinium sp. CCMP2456]